MRRRTAKTTKRMRPNANFLPERTNDRINQNDESRCKNSNRGTSKPREEINRLTNGLRDSPFKGPRRSETSKNKRLARPKWFQMSIANVQGCERPRVLIGKQLYAAILTRIRRTKISELPCRPNQIEVEESLRYTLNIEERRQAQRSMLHCKGVLDLLRASMVHYPVSPTSSQSKFEFHVFGVFRYLKISSTRRSTHKSLITWLSSPSCLALFSSD